MIHRQPVKSANLKDVQMTAAVKNCYPVLNRICTDQTESLGWASVL